ncbi:MAG: hypothetical protein HOE90_24130 [Bacteriovoracaceae bacterium]|jgi:hypothetical protein|nr:hypothetical protein [Bacteriovoracaceae bacterium]
MRHHGLLLLALIFCLSSNVHGGENKSSVILNITNSGEETVYKFRALLKDDGSIDGFDVIGNPNCYRSIPTESYFNGSGKVVLNYQKFKKVKDKSSTEDQKKCKFYGKEIITSYMPGEYSSRNFESSAYYPLEIDYLINGVSGTRSEKLSLALQYSQSLERWVMTHGNSSEVINGIHFILNRKRIIGTIGIKEHEFN